MPGFALLNITNILILMLRPTVSRPVYLGIKHPSGAYDQMTGLSFTIVAGPCQRCHSLIRAPWDSRPYFTVSDLRLPISSPPTTRRVTVEVFDPASTRVLRTLQLAVVIIASARTAQRPPLPTTLLFLRACLLRPIPYNGRYLQTNYLAAAVVWLLISRSLPSNWSICHNNFMLF
jgi:hypothetical protein